jgi:hypothetical protein
LTGASGAVKLPAPRESRMKWIFACIAVAFGFGALNALSSRRAGPASYRPAIGKLPTRKFV